MIPHHWVDATDLNLWANRLDAQSSLPQLVRRLIHATVEQLQRINIPAGDSVQIGGWDGIVYTEQGNAFVPKGCSAWEFGATKEIKGKADSDYDKRSKEPLDMTPVETTFIFVTPRRWGGKNKWIQEKKQEGIWAEVIAYDADDLEQWLELAPAVHTWLAKLLGKWSDDAQDLGSFWEEWTQATVPVLNSELHLANREEAIEAVINWLHGSPSKLTIQADSTTEAIAFFAAVVHQMPEEEQIQHLSRCVLAHTEGTWRYINNAQDTLVLVPKFGLPKSLPEGHHVLLPVGKENSVSKDILQLNQLDRASFRQALVNTGLSSERAYELTNKSKRSLTILRRLLASAPELHTPEWAKPENARALIPVLLAGAWDDTKQGDKEVIAKLARKPYEEVVADISRWVNSSDPPVRQVGSVWQLISREDSWHLLSRFIVRDDLEALQNVTLSVLGTLDPRYELPLEQRYAASIYGKELPNSGFLRKGLAETLAILATRGLPSQTQDIISAQERVNGIIYQLLNCNVDWHIWASLAYFLPTLAEASPEAFLAAVDDGLAGSNPTLIQLFFQEEFFGGSPHTGLLWALEVLAWEAQYLSQITLIFGKLSRLDPGGKIINRPFLSLCEIFLCWNPQTPATLAQRLRVIDTLIAHEPDIAWRLLCNLLPETNGGISHPIYKPRWQDWSAGSAPKFTLSEYWKNVAAVMDQVLSNMGNDSKRLCDVIKKIESLTPELQNRTINHLLAVDTTDIHQKDLAIICDTLREIIHHHKKFSDTEWALPANSIDRFYLLHRKFEPNNIVYRYAWLFSFNPKFLYCIHEEHIHSDWQIKDKKIKRAQTAAARKVYFQADINVFLEMAEFVKEPGLLGAAIANIETITEKTETSLLYETLGNEKKLLNVFAIGFISRRLENYGWAWAENILSFAKNNHWTERQVTNFFYALPFEKYTWNLLIPFGEEIINLYWQTISTGWINENDEEAAIVKLLEFNRPYLALNLVNLHHNDQAKFLPSTLLVDILEKAVSVNPNTEKQILDPNHIGYRIEEIFDVLERAGDIEDNKLAFLEWIYLPLLVHSERKPKILYQELSKNPLFFVQILEYVYKPEDDKDNSEKIDQAALTRAELGSRLLESWHQVPGLKKDRTVDLEQLRDWVLQARIASKKSGRSKIADLTIGHVLAYSPKSAESIPLWQIYLFCLAVELRYYSLMKYISSKVGCSQSSDGIWPDIAVREIIEEVASKQMERGITTGVFNKRGVVTRSIGEGGIQERQLAETYYFYAVILGDSYPRTAAMLRSIADRYISNAHKQDIRAELED